MGYPIEGVAVEGEGEAEKPVAFWPRLTLPRASGLQEVRRLPQRRSGRRQCPWPGAVRHYGQAPRRHPGFAYSDALKGVGGTWDWDKMSAWLANPKKFAPGTKMTFAGLSNPQDRADLMLWLNSKGGSLTVPPPPAADRHRVGRQGRGRGRRCRRAEGRGAGLERGAGGQGRPDARRAKPRRAKHQVSRERLRW